MKRFVTPLLLAGLLWAPALAQDSVAKVRELKGPHLDYTRASKTYPAFLDMDGKIADVFMTDKDTVAALDFVMGGRVGINKGSKVTITSERSAKTGVMIKKIKLEKGGIWAKCDKLKEPLEVQTNGGVMGIKGTEFVVEANEGGDTKVSLLEGEIAVSAPDGTPLGTMKPGDQWLLAAKTAPVKKSYEPEKLREDIRNSTEWNTAMSVISLVSSFSGGIPYVGYYGSSIASLDFERDPAGAAVALANMATSAAGVGGGWGGMIGGAIAAGASGGGKQKPDFPTGLSPDNIKGGTTPNPLSFRWDPVEDAKAYVLLISPTEDFNAVEWSSKTTGTSVSYPANAQPLTPGRHYWRLVPVDENDKPMDGVRGSQTYFELR